MKPQRNRQLKQIQPLDTWIIDFIQFPSETNGVLWFLLFCEFNSRYLVIFPLNKIISNESYEQRGGRAITKDFLNIFDKFIEENTPAKLIGDSDKVFTSNAVKDLLNQADIKYEFKPSNETNHIHTSILDRTVRTLRDMLFNLKIKTVSPNDIKNLVHIYNNTRHMTLSKILGFPATPQMLHKNQSLQLLFIRRLRSANWLKMKSKGYVIENSSNVFVRAKYNTFEKKRAKVKQDIYEVIGHKGAMYELKNNKTGEKIEAPRRDLKLQIPRKVKFQYSPHNRETAQ